MSSYLYPSGYYTTIYMYLVSLMSDEANNSVYFVIFGILYTMYRMVSHKQFILCPSIIYLFFFFSLCENNNILLNLSISGCVCVCTSEYLPKYILHNRRTKIIYVLDLV